MAHNFHPYPNRFATDAIPLVLNVVRGQPVDAKEAAHAIWDVGGYALSQWDKHPTPAFGAAPLKGEALCEALESAGAPGFKGDVNWKGILDGLIDLLHGLLNK